VPPLAARARALQQARASGDQQAQRQALIDVAAASIAMAARVPAPTHAFDELELGTTRVPRLAKKHARRSTTESKAGKTTRGPRPRRPHPGATAP